MNRIFKWLAYVAAGMLVLLVVSLATLYLLSARLLERTYDVAGTPVTVPSGPAAVAEGERLATIRGCNGCHGDKLEGQMFVDELMLARIAAPNLSRVASGFTDAELERVIRHGVKTDGRGVVAMPSSMFAPLSDVDLGLIIAYVRSAPPVGREWPARRIGPLGRLGLLTGEFHTEPSVIDHAAPHPATAPTADRLAFGRYLALTSCSECHGPDLKSVPGARTPSLVVAAAYSDSALRSFFKTGNALGNRLLRLMSEMAEERFSHFTDAEVGALLAYLKTLQ